MAFAYVNALEERVLARELNTTCIENDAESCVFNVFKAEYHNGRKAFRIHTTGLSKFKIVMDTFKILHGPCTLTASKDMLHEDPEAAGKWRVADAQVRANGRHIFGFFHTEDDIMSSAFAKLAVTMSLEANDHDNTTFHTVTDGFLPGHPPPAVFVSTAAGHNTWGPGDVTLQALEHAQQEGTLKARIALEEQLDTFVRQAVIMPVMKFDGNNIERQFTRLELSPVFIFVNDSYNMPQPPPLPGTKPVDRIVPPPETTLNLVPAFYTRLAQRYNERVGMVQAGIYGEKHMMKDFGYMDINENTTLPLVGISNTMTHGRVHYSFHGNASDEAEVRASNA